MLPALPFIAQNQCNRPESAARLSLSHPTITTYVHGHMDMSGYEIHYYTQLIEYESSVDNLVEGRESRDTARLYNSPSEACFE